MTEQVTADGLTKKNGMVVADDHDAIVDYIEQNILSDTVEWHSRPDLAVREEGSAAYCVSDIAEADSLEINRVNYNSVSDVQIVEIKFDGILLTD